MVSSVKASNRANQGGRLLLHYQPIHLFPHIKTSIPSATVPKLNSIHKPHELPASHRKTLTHGHHASLSTFQPVQASRTPWPSQKHSPYRATSINSRNLHLLRFTSHQSTRTSANSSQPAKPPSKGNHQLARPCTTFAATNHRHLAVLLTLAPSPSAGSDLTTSSFNTRKLLVSSTFLFGGEG